MLFANLKCELVDILKEINKGIQNDRQFEPGKYLEECKQKPKAEEAKSFRRVANGITVFIISPNSNVWSLDDLENTQICNALASIKRKKKKRNQR